MKKKSWTAAREHTGYRGLDLARVFKHLRNRKRRIEGKKLCQPDCDKPDTIDRTTDAWSLS